LEGWNSDSAKLREIESTFDNLFERAKDQNIAQAILDAAAIAQTKLKSSFSLGLEYDAEVMDRLESMAKLIQHRPVSITPQLIEWSNRE
jgi:hypothetical protein